jgi:hypothetical protein
MWGQVDGGRRKAVDRASAARVEISGASCRAIVKFPPFHGGNTSSNLVRDAKEINYLADFLLNLSNICLISSHGCVCKRMVRRG